MDKGEEIRRLEEAMARLDEADPDEVDGGEYQRILARLVELRERDSVPRRLRVVGRESFGGKHVGKVGVVVGRFEDGTVDLRLDDGSVWRYFRRDLEEVKE